MSTRKNEYEIAILFDCEGASARPVTHQVPYPFSRVYTDRFEIAEERILISAKRSNPVELRGIFTNHQSALYRQITKALAYYYCHFRKSHQIKSIKVTHHNGRTKKGVMEFDNDIIQVCNSSADLSLLSKIKDNELKVMFSESPKGHAYLSAITHLVKSYNAETPYEALEKRWKSFNAIYRNISNKNTDFDAHVYVRNEMINNPSLFPLINSAVDNISAEEIRGNTRWIKFIHNDFSNEKKARAFKEFVLRNEDSRLVKIFKETLSVREKFLKDKNYYNDVVAHLNANVSSKNNMHVAATICIKYTYFVRNKTVHAESADSGFRVIPFNKEETESKWLGGLLSLLIFDLINAQSYF